MAKYRRYRKYTRRGRGRWSANIKTLTKQTIQATTGSFFGITDLCLNPIQSDTTVSQQYTVKNIEISFEIEGPQNNIGNTSGVEGLTSYIMFVPQGMTVTETYPNTHPEYIMAYRFLGSPNLELSSSSGLSLNPGRNPLRVKTRMARRLQTGDKIILLVVGQSSVELNLEFNGIVRWWTKAN